MPRKKRTYKSPAWQRKAGKNPKGGLNATIASRKVLDLASSAKSEYVQLEASKDILDRAGYKPVEKSMSLVQGNISVSIDLT